MLHMMSLLALNIGCSGGEPESKPKAAAPSCSLNLDSINNTEWLYLRANPDKTETPDELTRLKFYTEGKDLKAKYNTGSFSEMHTYECSRNAGEMKCVTKPDAVKVCAALLVGGKKCTKNPMRRFYEDFTDTEIAEGKKEAEATYKALSKKKGREFNMYKLSNNNLANKLMGLLYITVDKQNCRLQVTDNYASIYNGEKMEDSNPAGINPFVKNEQGELLWEHCPNQDLVDTTEAEFPENPIALLEGGGKKRHAPNDEIHYWMLNVPLGKIETSCTYSYDLWLNFKPYKKSLMPKVVKVKGKDQNHWHFSHTFDKPSQSINNIPRLEVFTLVADKTCGDKKDRTVHCSGVIIE
jgi:hypothetical protein